MTADGVMAEQEGDLSLWCTWGVASGWELTQQTGHFTGCLGNRVLVTKTMAPGCPQPVPPHPGDSPGFQGPHSGARLHREPPGRGSPFPGPRGLTATDPR